LSEEEIRSLEYCERILVQNKAMESFLISQGIPREAIVRAPGAVNREVYHPSTELSETKYVLFSGDFKYRKNPDLIAQVIAAMPDINFIVHGKNWEVFPPEFLNELSNLRRLDFKLVNQPSLIRHASLYVSLARIEGGPYPVLEALASGTPVVATHTGFCAEFVNANNGILLPNSAELESVIPAIRQALSLKGQVWDQDLLFGKWQWKNLGSLIFN
jgi:glycosyltransferase involved in cell wall biosynthesis